MKGNSKHFFFEKRSKKLLVITFAGVESQNHPHHCAAKRSGHLMMPDRKRAGHNGKTCLDSAQFSIYSLAYTGKVNPVSLPVPSSRSREAKLFRNNRSQAVRIPVEFELPGDRVLIRREGGKLIIEPITKPANIIELLAAWKSQPPLGPEDQFPEIEDIPAKPEDIF